MKLKFIENKDLDKLLKRRKGEVKLGEKLNYLNKKSWSQLDTSTAKYVILGVEEDLGLFLELNDQHRCLVCNSLY